MLTSKPAKRKTSPSVSPDRSPRPRAAKRKTATWPDETSTDMNRDTAAADDDVSVTTDLTKDHPAEDDLTKEERVEEVQRRLGVIQKQLDSICYIGEEPLRRLEVQVAKAMKTSEPWIFDTDAYDEILRESRAFMEEYREYKDIRER